MTTQKMTPEMKLESVRTLEGRSTVVPLSVSLSFKKVAESAGGTRRDGRVDYISGLGFNGAQMFYYLIFRHIKTTKN